MKHLRIIVFLVLATLLLGLALPGWGQATAPDFLEQGQKLMAAGRCLQAAEAYKQAIRLQPDLDAAHLGLKEAYWRLGFWKKMQEARRLLQELPPDDAVAHYDLGLLYLEKGDYGYAQDECRILQKLDPALARRLDQAIRQGR
jgi:tetratricopeptide (TPR) repeat protein